MKTKIFAAIMLVLIVCLPIASANVFQDIVDYGSIIKDSATDRAQSEVEAYKDRYAGESIVVNVKTYEPTVIVASLLEQDDIPVYAYLQGATLGSVLGIKSSEGPFYGTPPIKYVTVTPESYARKYVRGVKYVPPTYKNYILSGSRVGYQSKASYTLDNLGYLIITLKKIEKEKDVPQVIDLNFSAKIFFDSEKGLGFGQQDIMLGADPNEDTWLKKSDINNYAFFSGRGYIRASNIDDEKATFYVYSGIERLGAGALNKIGSFSLKPGETSKYLVLTQARDLPQNTFRVKLNGLVDPNVRKARIQLNVDGLMQEKILSEGSAIYQDSTWKVKSITTKEKSGNITEEVVLSGPEGEAVLKRTYPLAPVAGESKISTEMIMVKFNENNTLNLPSMKLKELKETLLPLIRVTEILVTPPTILAGNIAWVIPSMIKAGNATSAESPSPVIVTIDLPKEFEEINSQGFKTSEKQTLPSVLNKVLPAGYGFYVSMESPTKYGITPTAENQQIIVFHITTKSAVAQKTSKTTAMDPCANVALIDFSMGNEEEIRDKITKASDTQLYCTAIEEFRQVIMNYKDVRDDTGILWESKAYYNIAQLYLLLNAPLLALQNFEKAVIDGRGEFVPQARYEIERLKTIIAEGSTIQIATFEDAGRQVQATLLEIMRPDSTKVPSATIRVDDRTEQQFRVGQDIFESSERIGEETYKWKWVIKEIKGTKVFIERRYIGKQPPDSLKKTVTSIWKNEEDLALQKSEIVDGHSLFLLSIQSYKEAFVTIMPGTGRSLISESQFELHLPVEHRAIDLNPNKIGEKINSTQKKIEKLTTIINKIDKLVTKWKTVCLAVFAWFTLKNSFLSGLSRSQARQNALRGIDGKGGWYAYCRANSGLDKLYKTFDKCMTSNAAEVEATIDASQNAINQVNAEFKNNGYKAASWYSGLTGNYSSFGKYGKYMEGELFDAQRLRNYRYYQLMKQSSSYQTMKGAPISNKGLQYNFASEVDQNLKNFGATNTKQLNAFNTAVNAINTNYQGFDEMPDNDKKQLFKDLYSQAAESQAAGALSEEFKFLTEAVTLVSVIKREGRQMVTNTLSGKVVLREATVQDYKDWLTAQLGAETNKESDRARQLQNEIKDLDKKLSAPLQSRRGMVFKGSDGKLYAALTTAYATEMLREDYAKNAVAEFYPDGKPYCIPTSKGNFIVVKDFYADNTPKTIQLWNVGPDGLLCTADDVLLKHESVLQRDEYEQRSLLTAANRVGSHKEGEVISASGRNFLTSTRNAAATQQTNNPTCFDTMDPTDCRLLFGVCDPVMCPPSRFNLAGAWPVTNVVATGLIGSIVLGLPNFELPYEPVPVCLTGISAGLQNIRSILQGYVNCLKTAKTQGKSVGICDKIRSIFICELLWNEALAIFKIQGGLTKLISKKVFGQGEGGGEYLTFQSSLQNVASSVKFFTQQYATTASASYKSRSTSEIGTEICKAAIYGKIPSLGDIVKDMSQPESPPQFTAVLTVMPYSETQRKSRYQVYYHIYAGANKKADYTVFLKNTAGNAYYVTGRCGGRIGQLVAGGLADETIDCVADSGFNEVCISVNGATECGFGKVSTSFALDYLNDLVYQDEAKRNIKSEEECVPSSSRLSPSMGSITVPGEFGLVSTGIVRVCSLTNPGTGKNPSTWRAVGTCGKDAQGHNLGTCWIDLSSISMNNLEKRQDLMNDLKQRDINITTSVFGLKLLPENEAKDEYLRIQEELSAKDCLTYMQKIIALKDLARNTLSPKIGAAAQFEAAELIVRLVQEKCNTLGKKTASPTPTPEPEPSGEGWEKWECRADGTFKYDSTEFVDIPAEQAKIKSYIDKVKDIGKETVYVYAFASEEGTADYNQQLSMQRAEAVADIIEPMRFASPQEQGKETTYTSIFELEFSGMGETQQFSEAKLSKEENRQINRRYILSTQQLAEFTPAPPKSKISTIIGCKPPTQYVSDSEAANAAAVSEKSKYEKIYLFVKKGDSFENANFLKQEEKMVVSEKENLNLFVYAKNSKTGGYYDNFFFGMQGGTAGRTLDFTLADTSIEHVKKLTLKKSASTSGKFWLDARPLPSSAYNERVVFAWFDLDLGEKQAGGTASTPKIGCEECDTFLKSCTYEQCLSGGYSTKCYYAKTLFLDIGNNCQSCVGSINSCEDYTTKSNPDVLSRICKNDPCGVGKNAGCVYANGACKTSD